jgi:D-alanine-D-alanine ligase
LEIKFNGRKKFLTFNKKEEDSDEFFCPANLSHHEEKIIDEYAKNAFSALGLRDYGRIDTKLTSEGFMLLEVNSFAGLTCTPPEKPHSYIGFMARAEGNGGKELLKEIVDVSMERVNN